MLISLETHITCDFPWGRRSGPPAPHFHSASAHVINGYTMYFLHNITDTVMSVTRFDVLFESITS